MSPTLPQRILIVRLGAIGDVVNASVLASALKRARPETHIGWAVHELARPLLVGHPAVDRVHLWRKAAGFSGFRGLVRELRGEHYDLAIDCQRLFKSALLARFSGAGRVLGYDRARTKEHSWLLTRERLRHADPGKHMVEQYLDVARHLGVENPRAIRELPLDGAAESWADSLVSELGAAPILISLGATKPANRWLPERFGELAGRCARELGVPLCLTGGPGEHPAGERALRAMGHEERVRNLVGKTSLAQLVALSRRARLHVGCDSGPMHVAAACERPVLALFGPADPRRTGPFGDGHRVLRVPPPCAPCNRKHCNQSRHACMEDIGTELVFEAVRELLGSSPSGEEPLHESASPGHPITPSCG